MSTSKRAEVVKPYIERNKATPSRTLAKLIVSENPNIGTVEDVRRIIRYYRGAMGTPNRLKNTTGRQPWQLRRPGDNYICEPPVSLRDPSPYIMPGAWVFVLCDIHFPFHDKVALEAAIKHARRYKIDAVLLNGDINDHYTESHFIRKCRPDLIQTTVDTVDEFLGYLRGKWKHAEIVWKAGNHEERMFNSLANRLPEQAESLRNHTFEAAGVLEHRVAVVGDKRDIYCGHLTILHGHEYRTGMATPVSPARTMGLKAGDQTLVGHWHRTSQWRSRTIRNNHPASWSVGCLCDLNPEYSPHNDWNHGFAIIERNGPDSFKVHNKSIIEGSVV